MDEDTLNMQVRKFLKRVGVSSQREIENAVQAAIDKGALQGDETLSVAMVLEVPELELSHRVEGEISLE